MNEGLISRGLRRVGAMFASSEGETTPGTAPRKRPRPPIPVRLLAKVRSELQDCVNGVGGEVSARHRAAHLAETYLSLEGAGKAEFLRLIAHEFGPDPARVAEAHAAYQAAVGTPEQWDAESRLRLAMRSGRIRILTQFNAIPQGVKFLVDLRADLQGFLENDPELKALDRELENRLTAWFDVGFLELQRISWHSPAALLEKLIQYEAVHEIRSWTDLKNRLDSDRRCYAFFHPRMPLEPLIFVEVALCDHLADNVQKLLDEGAPTFDAARADTAIFYSISNTQVGLRGVSFGNFLLKRVIDDLKRDFPRLDTFATLSPLPGLRRWVEKNPAVWLEVFNPEEILRINRLSNRALTPESLGELLKGSTWSEDKRLSRALQHGLIGLAARYLINARQGNRPLDPVARFHLGNGARVERLNFLADTSPKGFKQSYGLMVNYLYDPSVIEENVEAFSREGKVIAATSIRTAAR